MESWGTHFITFLIGVATGTAGKYFADKYTDKRHDRENEDRITGAFNRAKDQMPDLIKEMNEDFTNHANSSIRELAIISSHGVIYNSRQPQFIYYEDKHQNLRGKISILENLGFVTDVTNTDVPRFRITEVFWDLVLKT